MRIGILGAGDVARDHAMVAQHLGASVVAGSTRSQNSKKWQTFQKEYPQTEFVADAMTLLSRPDIDSLVACLPWNVQPDWAEHLLACEKPILIEKPLHLFADSLRDILSKDKLFLNNKLIGFNRRYYKTVARLLERIVQGGLRSAQIVISEDVNRLVARNGAEVLEFFLETSSCHILDIALHLFGPLQGIAGCAYEETRYSNPFTSYNGLLETTEGVPVAYSINADDPSPVGITCRFNDGTTWTLTPSERLMVFRGYDIVERNEDCQVRRYMPHVENSYSVDASFRPGFREQMAAFLSQEFGVGSRAQDCVHLLDLCAYFKKLSRQRRRS